MENKNHWYAFTFYETDLFFKKKTSLEIKYSFDWKSFDMAIFMKWCEIILFRRVACLEFELRTFGFSNHKFNRSNHADP